MARPRLYSNAQIIEALTTCKGLVYLAAKRLQCRPTTIYNRMRQSAEVRACVEAQRGEVLDVGELALYNAVVKGESWAIQFLLRTLGKERGYCERSQHEVQLSEAQLDDEIRRALDALAARREGAPAGTTNGQA